MGMSLQRAVAALLGKASRRLNLIVSIPSPDTWTNGERRVGAKRRAESLLVWGLVSLAGLSLSLVMRGPLEAFAAPPQSPPSQSRQELQKPFTLEGLAPAVPRPHSSRGTSWSKKIEILIDASKFEEARIELRREIEARGENHEAHYLEAKLLFKEKRFYESLKSLQRCLSDRKDDPRVYMLVASNGLLLNRNDIAEPALKSAIQLSPQDHVPHFQLGGLYYTVSDFEAAAKELREALRLKPDFMPAHLFLGSALDELEERDGALRSYRKAIELAEQQNLRQEHPYLSLGKFLLRLNRLDEALPYLRRAVEVNPQCSEALYLIGKALNAQDRETEAVNALLKSVQINPRYAEPHYMLSRIYLKLGRQEKAEEEFRVFQELKREEKQKDDGRGRRIQDR